MLTPFANGTPPESVSQSPAYTAVPLELLFAVTTAQGQPEIAERPAKYQPIRVISSSEPLPLQAVPVGLPLESVTTVSPSVAIQWFFSR